MGIVNWRQVAHDRNGWRRGTGDPLILLRQWSRRRKKEKEKEDDEDKKREEKGEVEGEGE
jgi:hypothetical protein